MGQKHYNYCSFCGYRIDRVEFLIVGPGVSICNHCAQSAVKIYEDAKQRDKMEEIARQEFFNMYGSDV